MKLLSSLKLVPRMNWLMTAAILALIAIGITSIYSACYVRDDRPMRDLYQKQVFWACAGFGFYVFFAVTDYRRLRKLAWWAYGVALLLLVVVLVAGTVKYGARRWLDIFGFSLQPSELAKLAVIFVLARRLSRPGENLGHWQPLLEVLLILGVPCLLIMKEPDLGTALVLVPVTFMMMFVGGVPYRVLALLVVAGVSMVLFVLALLFLPGKLHMSDKHQQTIMQTVGLSAYHRDRLMVFFDSDRDPLGAGWNKRQSEIAVGSGGFSGKGYLKGTQNILGFLPRSVAPTDFIFSVIAEEQGFVGSATVLGLFAVLILCGLRVALHAPDKLGRLLSTGIVTMVFAHVFVNTAMTVGLMPITGIPLPLLSYGGSFMLVMMSVLGMLQSVHIRSQRTGLSFEQGVLWQSN